MSHISENITYFAEHRPASYSGANQIQYETQTIEFHPTSVAQFHSSSNQFPSSTASFITSTGQVITADSATIADDRIILQPHQRMITVNPATGQQNQIQIVQMPTSGVQSNQPQHILITTQSVSGQNSEQDDNRRVAFAEYFVEQPQAIIATPYAPSQSSSSAKYGKSSTKNAQVAIPMNTERTERDVAKRAKQAEAARQRYHRLNADQKKELNLKRTLAQKRKRQREREMTELETILRESNDIVDDPEVTEQLREKRMRARWAEAARSRYQRMSSEERRAHNTKRRLRQLTVKNEQGEVIKDETTIRDRIKEKNNKKAEAARLRYHRMTPDEKKMYNQRRTEAFRKRRLEEEALLAMPIGRINGEALDRAQQIVVRNAKRAEAARLRYQRMTPDQRKAYNQKRYTPKRKREQGPADAVEEKEEEKEEEYDALSSLERDVLKRTQQAQQVILRQRAQNQVGGQVYQTTAGHTIQVQPSTSVGAHLMQQHQPSHQQVTFY